MELTWQLFNPESEAPRILLLAPSLAGHVEHQWGEVARLLAGDARVVLVYLPGHGPVAPWDDADEATLDVVASGMAGVAAAVREAAGDLPVYYAGLSVSGAVGLHLARDYPQLFAGIAVVASAATVGEPAAWRERAAQVEDGGTAPLADPTVQRWFTPAFAEEAPAVVAEIRQDILDTDDHSYAQLCRALAVHDVRDDLPGMTVPLLVIAGEEDASNPLEKVRLVTQRVPEARLVVIPGVAHQVPVAAPEAVAGCLRELLLGR
ncbi:MAG TPA: alpha/beta hydrolase [Arachnia sp.]|nr:alpha/beta hydrolase [Arachnia sp.]HMT85229.1 alpha/beta hydrolase [Arachnia sp.]